MIRIFRGSLLGMSQPTVFMVLKALAKDNGFP